MRNPVYQSRRWDSHASVLCGTCMPELSIAVRVADESDRSTSVMATFGLFNGRSNFLLLSTHRQFMNSMWAEPSGISLEFDHSVLCNRHGISKRVGNLDQVERARTR
ncbi:MAG: hypothetical protein JO070_11590 [Verrucomicrobia bacterium]|nr:hypothetical protein [Verrucomicrobiota bacterium]